jgi:hypothetical protein
MEVIQLFSPVLSLPLSSTSHTILIFLVFSLGSQQSSTLHQLTTSRHLAISPPALVLSPC